MEMEDVKAACAAYRMGRISRKEYAAVMAECLGKWTYYTAQCMKDKAMRCGAAGLPSIQDLVQEGMVAMLEELDKYRPEAGAPTTFFTLYMKARMRALLYQPGAGGATQHYAGILDAADRVCKEHGVQAEDAALEDIFGWVNAGKASKISLVSLRASLSAREHMPVPYETLADADVPKAFTSPDPADLCVATEEMEALNAALSSLSPLERFVLIGMADLGGIRPVREALADESLPYGQVYEDELAGLMGPGGDIRWPRLKNLASGAVRKTRQIMQKAGYGPVKENAYGQFEPQASIDGMPASFVEKISG